MILRVIVFCFLSLFSWTASGQVLNEATEDFLPEVHLVAPKYAVNHYRTTLPLVKEARFKVSRLNHFLRPQIPTGPQPISAAVNLIRLRRLLI